MIERPITNWVFLGDSLTEGVGSSRVSYVTELVNELRAVRLQVKQQPLAIHEIRLRKVDPQSFDRFIPFNFAGFLNQDQLQAEQALWIWNLSCEGRTIETDLEWVPGLNQIRPDLIVLFRGSLESIIRPAMFRDGSWPWWLPHSWRGYAAMDPRCYFSTTWWRRVKQVLIDALKQKARLRFLRKESGNPLLDLESLITQYHNLLVQFGVLKERVLILGLLPVAEDKFPQSPAQFSQVNSSLEQLAAAEQVTFLNWAESFMQNRNVAEAFYRDGFHPNLTGARALARILLEHLQPRLLV